jgi:hypothetical protein
MSNDRPGHLDLTRGEQQHRLLTRADAMLHLVANVLCMHPSSRRRAKASCRMRRSMSFHCREPAGE